MHWLFSDLLTEPRYNSILLRIEELRRRKHFNIMTYIPDIFDKKLRNQTFLQNIAAVLLSAAVLCRQEAGEVSEASEAPAPPGPSKASFSLLLILLIVTRDSPVSAWDLVGDSECPR